MTETETGLQAALDQAPTNALLRLILADHLEELGDPRAAGYRALGELGLSPANFGMDGKRKHVWWFFIPLSESARNNPQHTLGAEWDRIYINNEWRARVDDLTPSSREHSRQGEDDWAALAWLGLTQPQQRTLLKHKGAGA